MNFPATVLHHFSELRESPFENADLAPPLNRTHYLPMESGVQAIVCIMIDAFGHNQVKAQLQAGNLPNLQRLLDRGAMLASLTSVFPPSTAPANVSFATGLPPAQHGVVGFAIWLPTRQVVANMITGGPAGTSLRFETTEGIARGKTIFERLRNLGVECYVINLASLSGSLLSAILYRGATFVPYVTPSTVAIRLDGLIEGMLDRHALGFVFVYWPHIDTIAHQTGTASPEYAAEARLVDHFFFGWLAGRSFGGRVAAFVLADHGQTTFNPALARLVNDLPEITSLLARPPAGEHRALYVKAVTGREDELYDRIVATLGQDASVLKVADAVHSGLFGPPDERRHPELEERIGNWILLAHRGVQLNYAYTDEQRGRVFGGGHSGLTPEEMLIPLLSVQL